MQRVEEGRERLRDRKCLCCTWREHKFTWTVMPQGYTENLTYFSQTRRAHLNNIKFPRNSSLTQYVGDLLLGF